MKKKIIITVIVLVILAGAAAGGIFAYKSYQENSLIAEVTPIASLNWGYWESDMQSYGMITNDRSQDIYLDSSQVVSELYVEEGQQVEKGDKLLSYDITEMEISLEIKQLEVSTIENKIKIAQKQLTELKNTKPVSENKNETPQKDDTPKPEKEKSNGAYNYISKKAKAYTGDGSEENPYRFLCNEDCYVTGSYLNYLRKKSYLAIFEIRADNKKTGTIISSWMVNGAAMEEVADDSKWSVLNRTEVIDAIDDFVTELPIEETPGYTAAELAQMIREKEQELKDLDLQKRTTALELQSLEKNCEDGVVYALFAGVVQKAGEIDGETVGTPFLSVSGSEGVYVKGAVSEMDLAKVKVGQTVTAMSFDSGVSVEATVTEISDYPESTTNYNGGNPNASSYTYTAYIEDSSGLKNGEYVQLTMQKDADASQDDSVSERICIPKAYVRQENGTYYVLKADENDRLVKQCVSARTVYGSGVLIQSGLSNSDRIAFPYGKTAKEGVKVKDAETMAW